MMKRREECERNNDQTGAGELRRAGLRLTKTDVKSIRRGYSRQHAGTAVHRYTESILAPVEKDKRGANAKTCIKQPHEQREEYCVACEESCQSSTKPNGRFTETYERHCDQSQEQQGRGDHLLLDEVAQVCVLVLSLGHLAHQLEFDEISEQVCGNRQYRTQAQTVIGSIAERDEDGDGAYGHCAPREPTHSPPDQEIHRWRNDQNAAAQQDQHEDN